MRITVIGCGYLGATHAASMAGLGHDVLGVEIDPTKRERLARGEVPFHEPGLPELLEKQLASGQLRFTGDYAEAGAHADLHFLCVGTPQRRHSMGADLSQVFGSVEQLVPHLRPGATVVGKSTVPVGTAPRLAELLEPVGARLVWNPEFLREGFAMQDTMRPDRIVLGGPAEALAVAREFYADLVESGVPVVETDYATAELVKVSANAFLATKISFINAVAEVCDVSGADVAHLATAIGYDDRIGDKFLQAGIGFGGGCLPKDIRAFVHRAGELGVDEAMGFLRQVDGINQRARHRAIAIVEDLVGRIPGARVALLGAAFKPDSDDVRDSPALWIAGQLHLRGADVRVHDPVANDKAAEEFPTLTYVDDAIEVCRGADVVLHLTAWPQFLELDPVALAEVVAAPRVLDGRNLLDAERWRDAGWTYRGMGRWQT